MIRRSIPMRIRVLNRFWNLRFAPNLANRGDCDPPDKPGKEIRVSSTLRGEERLEVLVHELVHAAGCPNLGATDWPCASPEKGVSDCPQSGNGPNYAVPRKSVSGRVV